MAKASLNIRLDYDQVLALVRQLCDEDKSRLKDELMAETTRKKLLYFQNLFSNEESVSISMEEIQEEVNIVRRERYEARQKNQSNS